VNHSAGENARNDAHINIAESYFATMKRGIYGIFHNVSKKNLPYYGAELDFCRNHRKVNDGERTIAALSMTNGKRLRYA
jgi:hypothetical protein